MLRKVLREPDSCASNQKVSWSATSSSIQVKDRCLISYQSVPRTDGSVTSGGFRAIARFTYGPDQGCGGLVNLTEGRRTITSLDLDNDGNYEPELNCQWTVVAPAGKVVKLRVTQFDLEVRQNDTHQECWDYLEIRNGEGPFAPKVRF